MKCGLLLQMSYRCLDKQIWNMWRHLIKRDLEEYPVPHIKKSTVDHEVKSTLHLLTLRRHKSWKNWFAYLSPTVRNKKGRWLWLEAWSWSPILASSSSGLGFQRKQNRCHCMGSQFFINKCGISWPIPIAMVEGVAISETCSSNMFHDNSI